LGKISTTPFEKIKNPKVIIFIKPWDDEVFACFLTLLKYIQENQCRAKIDCFVEKWLYDMVEESETATQLGITLDALRLFDNKDDELKCKINYLLTLGGDGTILYAAK
jgi:NAD kinase